MHICKHFSVVPLEEAVSPQMEKKPPTDIFCTADPCWWGSHASNMSLSHITNPASLNYLK